MPATDRLDPDLIKAGLNTKRIGSRILVYSCTSSTNDVAAEYAGNEQNDGTVIFAEEQTAGRGRGGNKWLTGQADSILCSIVLTRCRLNSELLSLVSAVAVAEAIGNDSTVKWPNDIMLNGKKVAGLLLESKTYNSHTAYIIGTGINCHQKPGSFPPELRSTATSIDIEAGTACDRISLAKRLITSFEHWLEIAEKDQLKVTEQWRKLSTLLNQRVTLVFDSRQFTGHCIGLNPQKGLILQLDTGGVRMFDAAHTTIVG